jgi:hypothetical protein
MEHHGARYIYFLKSSNFKILKSEKYQDLGNNLYYLRAKKSCEKTMYFSLCKKREKIADLGMNSAILNGPPVFSNFGIFVFFIAPKIQDNLH